MNQKHLQHDTLTDVITFPLEESDTFLEAEIYISIDRIKENALKFNASFEQELMRIMVHGVLHLIGYNDKAAADKEKMKLMEDHWLGKLNEYSH